MDCANWKQLTVQYRGWVGKLRQLYCPVRDQSDPTTYRVIQLSGRLKLETPRETKTHRGGMLVTTESGRLNLPLMSIEIEDRIQTFWATEEEGSNATDNKTPCTRPCKAPLQCRPKKEVIVHWPPGRNDSRWSRLYPWHSLVGITVECICGLNAKQPLRWMSARNRLIPGSEELEDNENTGHFTLKPPGSQPIRSRCFCLTTPPQKYTADLEISSKFRGPPWFEIALPPPPT